MADDPSGSLTVPPAAEREPPLRSSPRLHPPEQTRDQQLRPSPRPSPPEGTARSTGVQGLFGRRRAGGRGRGTRGASQTVVARPALAPKARRSVSRFTEEETDDMLSAIEDVLPIGQQEWERVVETNVWYYPQNQRDAA